MNSTPNSNRKHISIYGKTNAGKSSLINGILGQDLCLVSKVPGTTTDPVLKAMELIPVGPVLFIDTAGLDDQTELGSIRMKKSIEMLKRTDFALYVMDVNDIDEDNYYHMKIEFKKYNISSILVINKIDVIPRESLQYLRKKYTGAFFVSAETGEGIEELKKGIAIRLEEEEEEEMPIIGDLVPYDGKVVLVIPVDSEAPKGRIILPQVQCLRDCLDYGIKAYVVRDTELSSALEDIQNVELVVTDSQAFKKVSRIVPGDINLTGFSILFARHKGDLKSFVDGTEKIKELNENSKILICESCTHNVSHEDIGRVKIPKLLNKAVGVDLEYHYKIGHDFPEDLSKYDLVIHCGACMINRKTVTLRVKRCKEQNVAITNYGVIFAYLNGILDRSIEIFDL